ncbi:MAG TPA: DeoR/GlpR family DNA-binding transcription regulator [Victivallales bacterium]|nr:DeoR/GlpR family DNA-binding transcription regulator [Victivallales bacterium]
MENKLENIKNRGLFSLEREKLITTELGKGAKSLEELSSALGVSTATVRRDLMILEKKGIVRRIHGGAIRLDILEGEPIFNEKKLIREKEKSEIALKAASLLSNGDSVYLDGGSTVLGLCQHLKTLRNLSIVTNSIMAIFELMDSGHKLYLVGGAFRPLSRTIVGAMTSKTISLLNFDKAFIGTIGITEDGISTTDPDEAYTKELVMRRSETVILLADSSKFGKKSLAISGDISDIDIIITDNKLPAKFAKFFQKKKIKLII